jgi:hypothetical protein
MRLRLISCELFEREVREVLARSSNRVDVEFLPKLPHCLSDRETLVYMQTLVDRAAANLKYQAILLVAGSCRHSLNGLYARRVPLVLPRVKDCIGLLMAAEAAPRSRLGAVLHGARDWRPQPGSRLPLLHPEKARRTSLHRRAWTRGLRTGIDLRPHFGLRLRGRLKDPVALINRPLTVLEMLVNGYWNYREFLVVPAGWRVVVRSPEGMLSAEETAP